MVERLDEIKELLLRMKAETLKEISKSLKSTSDVPSGEPSGDIYDQASSERDRELGLLLGDREREKLRNIDEALLKFEEGEYGICEECGDDIPLGRLKVMPFARYCVRCKSDIEKMQAQTKRFEEDRTYNEISFGDEEDV
jgi:DnaK suppressor protein